jgi:hypothetical protein
LDIVVVLNGIWPSIQVAGTGQDFWNQTSESIMDVWDVSILVLTSTVIIKSTILAKLRGSYVDILTNPKKRFLIPICLWILVGVSLKYLSPLLSDQIVKNRYIISSQLLVWGWVAFEFPMWLMHRRLLKQL